MTSSKLPYRPHIDGLRAIAVLGVVGFHAFPSVVPGGFVGVDVFFVISGFLISGILFSDFAVAGSTGGQVIRNFYARRIRRIFPALIVVLLAVFVFGFITLLPQELRDLSRRLVGAAGFCSNFQSAGETSYFAQGPLSNPFLHLWSLAVEEQFYLLWPLVVWLLVRSKTRALPVVVFLAACSYFWNASKPQDSIDAAFFLPQMRMWELLMGAIAALISRPISPASERENPGARSISEGRGSHWGAIGSAAGENLVSPVGVALVASSLCDQERAGFSGCLGAPADDRSRVRCLLQRVCLAESLDPGQ